MIGALVGPSIVLRDWRWVRRPGVWVGLGVGVAVFVTWAMAAKLAVRHAGAAADTRGVREALERLVLHRWRDVLPAVAAPVVVLAYAVPVSLAVPFAVWMAARPSAPPVFGFPVGVAGHPHPNPLPGYRESGPEMGRRIIAVLATIAAGLLLFVVAGTGNPRYEYVVLPLLGMVVGGVAAGRDRLTAGERRVLYLGLGGVALIWGGLQGGATALVWRAGVDHAALVGASLLSTAATLAWFRLGRPVALAGVVVVLLAVPLVDRKNLERQRRSTLGLAPQLRAVVGGSGVSVASENWDVPELFHYAGVPVTSYGEGGLARLAAAPGGRWVVLSQTPRFPEYRTITSQVPGRVPRRGDEAQAAQGRHALRRLVRPAGGHVAGRASPRPWCRTWTTTESGSAGTTGTAAGSLQRRGGWINPGDRAGSHPTVAVEFRAKPTALRWGPTPAPSAFTEVL